MSSSSKKITIVVPGLFGKLSAWNQQYDISLETPSLRTLLASAKFSTSDHHGLLATINGLVPLPGTKLQSEQPSHVYYIEPIFLEEGIGHLIAREFSSDNITNKEISALATLLEPVLHDYQLQVDWLNPCFGNVLSTQELHTSHLATMDIIGDNLLHHMPEGNQGETIRQLLNLIQMQLFDCDINKNRLSKGFRPINSVWIWKNTHKPLDSEHSYDCIISDNALLKAVCSTHQIEHKTLAQDWKQVDKSFSSLIVLDKGFFQQKNDNINQWLDFMHEFENKWCQPILHDLQTQKANDIVLLDDEGRQFSLRKKAWWKPRLKSPELITWTHV